MEPGKDDFDKLTEILKDVRNALVSFQDRRPVSQAVVHQYSAGSHAVWVVVVCTAIIFTTAITLGPRISRAEERMDKLESELASKQERMQDYLNNIYQQAPWLKPKEKDVNDNYHNDSSKEKSDRVGKSI